MESRSWIQFDPYPVNIEKCAFREDQQCGTRTALFKDESEWEQITVPSKGHRQRGGPRTDA